MNFIKLTLLSFSQTLFNVMHNYFAVSMGVFIFFLDMISKNHVAFFAAFFGIVLDLIWGIAMSVKIKNFSLSKLVKKMMIKLFIYLSILSMIMLIERGMNDEWYLCTRIICTVITCSELWSMMAHMLVVKPNFPFISLFKKALAVEIANKLNLSKDDVEKIMK